MPPERHHRRGLAGGFATAVAVLAGLALAAPAGAATLPPTTCSLDPASNTRTCDLYAQTGTVDIPAEAKATLSQGNAVSHDAVIYTAASTGPVGNDVTVSYTAAAASQALAVHVVDLAIEVQLATGADGLPTSTAADVTAAINGDAAASALVLAALPAGDPGTGIPTPVGPTHLAGGSSTLPVWAFSETAGGHPTRIGGPTLVAISGETLVLRVHNEIPGEEVNLAVPQQPAAPMATKAATGGTVILTINGLKPGTSIYEAGSKTLASSLTAADLTANAAADDVEQQVAMGLYGALVVRPTGAGGTPDIGTAYGAGTAYQDEALLVLSEIDPRLNTSADPGGFNMTSFAPAYRLINGHAYAGDGTASTAPIVATPGDGVLLRYVNAGVADHSMALLGVRQTVVGEGGVATHAREGVAETIPPGQTLDAIVHVPTGADGTNYLISDQGHRLDNAGAGWATGGGQAITTGGMLTFISATSSGTPVTCYGPSTSNVTAPDVTGAAAVPVSAHFTPCDGNAVTDAELVVDSEDTGTTYPATVVSDGAGGWDLSPGTVIPQAAITALASGDHVVFVRARDSDNKWGAIAADTFFVDKAGPAVTGVTVKPALTMGAAGTKVVVTLTADDSGLGNQNVMSGTATLDGTTTVNLTTQVPGHLPAPILAMTATFTLPSGVTEGTHTIALAATDALGNITAVPVTATFTVDQHGPVASALTIAPNPNNGTLDDPGQPGNVVVTAHLNDVNAVSGIARVEGFIDTPGAPGSGFNFVPSDGAFDSASEDVQVWIPLGTINSLSEGLHPLSVRGLDAAGNWGDLAASNIVIDRSAPTVSMTAQAPVPGAAVTLSGPVTDPVVNGASSVVQTIEWYVGTDPGVGAARTDGVTIGAPTSSIVVPLSALRPGASNTVFIRARDAAGNWSVAIPVTFLVPLPPTTTLFAYPFDGPLTVDAANPFSATAWSSSTRPTRLAIDTAIKAAGASSLRVNLAALAGTPVRTAWLTKRLQNAVGPVTVSLAFNPHRALFGAGGTTILEGFNGATGVFRLQVRQQGSAANPTYSVRPEYRPRLPLAWSPFSTWRNLPANNAFTTLKLSFVAGAGANAALRLTVGATTYPMEGLLPATLLGMNSVQLGTLDGVANTATGTIYFDSFVLTTP